MVCSSLCFGSGHLAPSELVAGAVDVRPAVYRCVPLDLPVLGLIAAVEFQSTDIPSGSPGTAGRFAEAEVRLLDVGGSRVRVTVALQASGVIVELCASVGSLGHTR